MKKEFIFLVLASFMCNSISAQRYFEANDIRYRVLTEADEASTFGTVSVAKPEVGEYEDDVVIPNVVKESNDQYADAYKVIGIDEKAFAESKYLESVELPASIEAIGKEAFRNSSIKKIVIPVGNLTEIDEMVFEESKLKSIKIPTTIKKISDRAFAYCFDLVEVVIGEGLTEIGKEAFKNCYKIETVSLPGTIRFIGRGCFENCYRISSIVLGANLKSIGDDAFYNCMSLRHVELPDGIKEIGQAAFMQSGLVEIKVSESVREIKKDVFAKSMLRSVSLPQRLRMIEDGAFYGLNLNKKVEIHADANVAQNAFEKTDFEFSKKQNEWKSFLRNHQKQIIKESVKDDEIQIVRGGDYGHHILIVVKGIAYCPSAIPFNSEEYGAMRVYGSSYPVVIGRGDEGLGDAYGPEVRIEEIKGDVVIPDVIEIKDGVWKGEYLVTEVGPMDNISIKNIRLPLITEIRDNIVSGKKTSKNESAIVETHYATNTEKKTADSEEYKKLLQEFFQKPRAFLNNDANLERFPTTASYIKEFMRLYNNSINELDKKGILSLFQEEYEKKNSYTKTFIDELRRKQFINAQKLQ